MASTANLGLPLLAPSQAQKHVSVNESLSIVDSVAQLTLESLTLSAAPSGASSGSGYGVPAGATGGWAGQGGKIAIVSNGGWRFVTPRVGWRAWVKDQGTLCVLTSSGWQALQAGGTSGSSGPAIELLEISHVIGSGAASTTSATIPPYCLVFGVTGRVSVAITGSLASWRIGTLNSVARYGAGLSKAAGSWSYGLTGQPMAYFDETPLVLSAEGGSFSGGTVKLAVHLLRLSVPVS